MVSICGRTNRVLFRANNLDLVHMALAGQMSVLVAMIEPRTYWNLVSYNNWVKVILYAEFTKSVYGILYSAFLFYMKLLRDNKQQGFTRNNYDPCVENETVNGKQMTVIWHVDYLKISHAEADEVTKLIGYLKRYIGNYGYCVVRHMNKLVMNLEFLVPGKVKIPCMYTLRRLWIALNSI